MRRPLTLAIALMITASSSYARLITPEKLKTFRNECLAAQANVDNSLDNNNAIKKCLTTCPENLDLNNSRQASICLGSYRLFKNSLAQKFSAPIPRVLATIDYRLNTGWKVISSDNTRVTEQCALIGLTAAKAYPEPLKGYQMMIAQVNEIPVGAVPTEAILINLRIETDKAQYKMCTAEVVFLHCPPHRAKFSYCNP